MVVRVRARVEKSGKEVRLAKITMAPVQAGGKLGRPHKSHEDGFQAVTPA